MKSKKMKQGMSWLLCMVMLLSNNVTVLADETDSSGEGQTQDVSAEETEASTEEAGVTTELETEETVETTEQTEPVEEEQPVYNEAVQLRHEFKDENGNVISVVTADIQEGSFEADASAISMEVDTLTEEEDSYMQGLIRENLPEYTYLGDYVLYDVVFKVNGELTDPMKEIKLTYEGTGIDVQDIQDAVVCQYNVADPEVTDDKDSVTEIIQRDDMIRYMEENGEDTSKVDDHDLSEVVLNENGTADQISMEVRKSSIFGCYVEELSQETAFTQEVNGTTITVTAPEGAFPMDADQVSMAAAPLSEEQAAAVEEQLSAQAESQGQELKGYAAYDISLWANGEEIQPQKPVTVTMENTGLDVAETLTAFQVSDEDNSVSNSGSIDENGTVFMETAAVLPAGAAAFGEPEVQDEEKQNQEIDDALANETAPETPDEEVTDSVVEKQLGDDEEEVEKDSKEEAGTDTSIEEKDNSKVENEDTEKEEDTVKKETDENSETVKKEETDDHTDTIENDKTAEENKVDDQEKTTADIEKTEETEKDRSYEASYSDDTVEISVTAEPGVLPENAKLEVIPIAKQDVSDKADEEVRQKQESINEKYAAAQKALEEKAEEDGKHIAGFVAYDISFLVEDENGKLTEIEPEGEVSVCMDYVNAVLPEGLDEEGAKAAEVSVVHMEEQEDGAVVAVNIEDKNQKVSVKTTEQNEVEKVEFTADQFSTYVLEWSAAKRDYDLQVTVQDENGGHKKNLQLSWKDYEDTVKEIAAIAKEIRPDGVGEFEEAKINGKSYKSGQIRYQSGNEEWQFRQNKNSSWSEINSLTFVYKAEESSTGQRFTTVRTDSTGVTINLFNYNSNVNNQDFSKNAGFKFKAGWGLDGAQGDTGEFGNFEQEIVKKNLVGNMPVLDDSNISLEDLFSVTDTDENWKTEYKDVKGLFQRDGQWYEYDSRKNHAQYNAEDNTLDVYQQALISEFGYNNNDDFKVGNFLPFNNIWNSKAGDVHEVTVDEQRVDVYDVRNSEGEKAKENTDLWFGMNVNTVFYQPKEGNIDDEPMVFEFSGDDDVWVFIDDVLVLDIGGIHGKIDGSINFSNGNVNVEGAEQTTIRQCFEEAYRETHRNASQQEVEKYLDNIFDGKTFKDYTPHRMNFFYLERGGGAANCKMKFNLTTLPTDSITVQKEIDNYKEGAYTDVTFDFKLYADIDGDGICEQITSETDGGKYKNYEVMNANASSGEERKLGSDGIFTLKHNQKAMFRNFKVGTKYYVEEVNMSSNEYDKVEVSGITDQTGDSNLESSTKPDEGYAKSKEVVVGEEPYLVFHNRCASTNIKSLSIQKIVEGGTSDDNFTFHVKVGGQPYDGKYTVSNQTYETEDGTITLQSGQTAVLWGYITDYNNQNIHGFPSGTSFEVTEVDPGNKYERIEYSISGATEASTEDNKASGKLGYENNTEVTVTNYLEQPEVLDDVPHTKTIDWLGDNGENEETDLRGDEYYRLYLDVTGIPNRKVEDADIVLVLDYSGSMKDNRVPDDDKYTKDPTRQEVLEEAAGIIINTLKPTKDSENRIAVYTFGQSAQEVVSLEDSVDMSAAEINTQIAKQNASGGTNYSAGFKMAQTELSAHAADNRKQFVVFVSDGEPTFACDEEGNRIGSGMVGDMTEEVLNRTYACAEQFANLNLDGFYSISIGEYKVRINKEKGRDEYINNYELLNNLTQKTGASDKQVLIGTDTDDIEEKFSTIAASITKQIANVTIQDTLSEYVQFVGDNGLPDGVKKIEGDQSDVGKSGIGLKVQVREQQGAELKDYTGDYTWGIDLSGEQPKVWVNFGEHYFLEKGKVYTISFNVKLTQEAYQEYEDNKYTYSDTGYKGTDFGTNNTSSEKGGLYSNKSATVTYSRVINGVWHEDEPQEYPKPVVQVPENAKIILQKQIDNYSEFDPKLQDDEFMIRLTADKISASAVLKHGDEKIINLEHMGSSIEVSIAEILPKEYSLSGITVQRERNGASGGPEELEGNKITVNAGETVTVTVHNTFENKPYFHNDDSKNNTFPHSTDKTKLSLKDMKKEDPQMDLLNAELGSEKD